MGVVQPIWLVFWVEQSQWALMLSAPVDLRPVGEKAYLNEQANSKIKNSMVTTGSNRRLPRLGKSRLSLPRASATGAVSRPRQASSTSSPHLSPCTPRPTPPHPISHAVTSQDVDDDFLVEEVLDSPTSTSSPIEDALLVLYSSSRLRVALPRSWTGASGWRLA